MSKQGQSCCTFLDFCDSNQSTDNSGAANSQPVEAPVIHSRRQRQQNRKGNEMKETEEFLAAELNKLSVQERAKALDDLHCVGEGLQETPETIQQSLAEFDDLVQTSANRIYSVAVNQNQKIQSFFEISEGKSVRCKTICLSDDEFLAAKGSVFWRGQGCS
jgi:hypothetical protein